MIKLIFISLLITPFCKTADNLESWNLAVQAYLEYKNCLSLKQVTCLNLSYVPGYYHPTRISSLPNTLNHLSHLVELFLADNLLTKFPLSKDPKLSKLEKLDLSRNQISYFDPQILQQLPELIHLSLNRNPITKEEVEKLEDVAWKTHKKLRIFVLSCGEEYRNMTVYPLLIKPAKRQ